MNINTIKKLNKVNQDFYNITANDFDDSRQYFWKGWERLIKYLDHFNELKLLDLGSGNSRFYQFIKETFGNKKINYLGIDNNQKLLDFANKKFNKNNIDFKLKNNDLITALVNKNDFIEKNNFNVIVSFGIFHHIPSFKLRLKLLKYLKSKISNDGVIIISLWQFMEYERFRKKISSNTQFKNIKLEKNDFILDWKRGEKAYRYCHFIDINEQEKLIKESGLKLLKRFRADGKEQDVNTYLILKKNNTNKKMLWPDGIRTISVFLVILIHTSANTVLSWGKISTTQWMVGNIFDSLARISVPLFVMLSGSLLLHKKESLEVFFKKRANRVLLPWFFWGSILLFFNNYFRFAQFGEKNFKLLLMENFLGGFWFIPMLIGIYIVTPIIKKFVMNATKNELKHFFMIWLILASIIPILNKNFGIDISFITPSWFLYLGYFIGGHYVVHKQKISNNLVKNAKILFLINFMVTVFGTYQLSLMKNEFVDYLYSYLSLNIVLMSFSSFVILFNFFKNFKPNKKIRKHLSSISQNSFGIFLSHIMIIRILPSNFHSLLSIPILTIGVFVVSNILVGILKKIPSLKKIVG